MVLSHDTTRAFIKTLPFTPDPFQGRAIAAVEDGRSVLVCAPTGSGKTTVADYAAYGALEGGQRLIYTTPIKALSNQKYRQMIEQYGPSRVGLVTGDTVINRTAPLVVMTTEILRNLLVVNREPLTEVGFVVVDEVHFLSDTERGVVWEESIIACPAHIQLVCLSATVRNAREVADWLSFAHGPTELILHDKRPVPLDDYVFTEGNLQLVRDAEGKRVKHFNALGTPRRRPPVHGRRTVGKKDDRRGRPDPQIELGMLLARMRSQDLLPAIYFRFGRRSAEELAWRIVQTEIVEQPAGVVAQDIRDTTARALQGMGGDALGLHQVIDLTRMLPFGVAYHHAGLIHPLKTLVEQLFADNLLQIVVATSTLAMGLHLPARSVVIGEMKKFNGESFEPLTATEYRQMTGRAGRRGIDIKGTAILVPSPTLPFEPAFKAMSGEPEPLRSAFELRYNTLLNTYRPDDEERIATFLEKNLAEFHRAHAGGRLGLKPRPTRSGRMWRATLSTMLDVLVTEHLLDEHGDLTVEGQVARYIFNPWEIAVTHMLFDGSLEALDPPRIAEALSLLIPSKLAPTDAQRDRGYHARRRRQARSVEMLPEEEIEYVVESTIARLRRQESRHSMHLTPEWVRPNHSLVRVWCERGSLREIVEEYELPAGDALGLLGQTLDLCEQCQAALGAVFGGDDTRVRALRGTAQTLNRDGLLERLLGV